MYIKLFKDISKGDVKTVGGKGASLGEMTQAGIPIPPGFVVTTETYRKFINDPIPTDVEQEILKAFDSLNCERVAVRSSAVAEDGGTASWAGQLESYLNVTRENLIEKIRECWLSIKSERALSYAARQDLKEEDLVVAVVIQKMVNSTSAGVIFSVNPITNNSQEIMIEAGWGLGEMLVQGMITPDNFLVEKDTLEIKDRSISTQEFMLVFKDGKNVEVPVPEDAKDQPAVTDAQIKSLAELAVKIEGHYGKPQDIEWAIEDENIYIVQSRPITTL